MIVQKRSYEQLAQHGEDFAPEFLYHSLEFADYPKNQAIYVLTRLQSGRLPTEYEGEDVYEGIINEIEARLEIAPILTDYIYRVLTVLDSANEIISQFSGMENMDFQYMGATEVDVPTMLILVRTDIDKLRSRAYARLKKEA